jgi:hypothetical protein
MPLFCYVLFYISCILANNKVWLFNEKEGEVVNTIIIQKNIIHTVLDLINSIIEANMIEGKDYLYEIIVTRFMIKLNHTFNDTQLLARIEKKSNKNISYDENTKKISINKNKIDYISLNNDITLNVTNKEYCEVKKANVNKVRHIRESNKTNFLTNCDNGRYHQWILKDNLIICNLCNKNYNELLKDTSRIKKDESFDYLHKIKMNQLLTFAKKYCLSGNLHQIDQNTSICSLCNINPTEHTFSEDELTKLSKSMENKENKEINKLFKKEKEYEKKEIEQTKLNKKLYKKFNKHFKKDILTKYKSNQYVNYLTDFIDRLINILGPKIKVQNKNIYLKDTLYTIDHDYLGNLTKNNITILSSENLIQVKQKFTPLDKDVLFYKDKSNNVYVYYDLVTLQYLGYSEDNKNIKKNKNNVSLIRELSILDILLTIGLENEYYNIKHLNMNSDNNKNLINSLLRNRIINLKQIILKFESIINSVRNHSNFN